MDANTPSTQIVYLYLREKFIKTTFAEREIEMKSGWQRVVGGLCEAGICMRCENTWRIINCAAQMNTISFLREYCEASERKE